MIALNTRQKRFCDEYLISLNATDAAKKVGYKGNYVGDGAQEVEQVPPTNTEKICAAEILGKYYKLFTDRQEIQLTGAVEFIDDISDGDTS